MPAGIRLIFVSGGSGGGALEEEGALIPDFVSSCFYGILADMRDSQRNSHHSEYQDGRALVLFWGPPNVIWRNPYCCM
jgi:hypothetical protein